ncbi:hypothetical protein GGR51DRAFT_389442 [Nemania sp. FL0031]|nr:hypothetical protein GGR51DRAFT_389442 [Nemania sp. FL0031]
MELHGRPLSDELIDSLTSNNEVWAVVRRVSRRDGIGILEPRERCQEPVHISLGSLDALPMELVHYVLGFLEFQPLMELMCVSRQWKIVVETLPAYAALTKHAQVELVLMVMTDTLKYHSISTLHNAMLSQKCASCFEFGGFLFLPTCERICITCLWHNQAYWMIAIRPARFWFSLTEEEVLALPVMKAVPDTYTIQGSERTRLSQEPLVSVKQTKELAIKVHGSARMIRVKYKERIHCRPNPVYQWLHDAPLEPPGRDLSREPMKPAAGHHFEGMAAIRFPYVHGEEKDIGRLCRGCEYMAGNALPDCIHAQVVPPGIDAWRPLRAIRMKLWSRRGFVEHISSCYGVEQLLSGRDRENESTV